jgi:hypothetical protein
MIRFLLAFIACAVSFPSLSQEVEIMPVYVTPAQVCEGSTFTVAFSTYPKDFAPDTKFQIRLSFDRNFDNVQEYLDVPATLISQGVLSARFPMDFRLNTDREFRVAIVIQDRGIVAKNDRVVLYVNPLVSVSLNAEKSTVGVGEQTYIRANHNGFYPVGITLTNGETINNSNLVVWPEQTTTYQIKSIFSGCGKVENPPKDQVTVTVRPSVFLPEPGIQDSRLFCEGQTARVPFKSAGIDPAATYSVLGVMYDGDQFVFPATQKDGYLEFFIPVNPPTDVNRDYGNISSLKVAVNNTDIVSPGNFRYKIKSRPHIFSGENGITNVETPSAIRVEYMLFGGAPFDIELADGTKINYEYRNYYIDQFVRKDTIFQIRSLSNQCFKNPDLPAFPLKVANPQSMAPALYVKLTKTPVCVGDSAEIDVFFSGQFEPGNEFSLHLNNHHGGPLVKKITRQGRHTVKFLDDGSTSGWLVLSSSLPRLVSETSTVGLMKKPYLPEPFPGGTKEDPQKFYDGDYQAIQLRSGVGTTIRYALNGVENSVTVSESDQVLIRPVFPDNRVSELTILSATNTCGTISGPSTSYYYAPAYAIEPALISFGNTFCVGATYEVPFSITRGKAGDNVQYTLQIGPPNGRGTFTDLATVSGGRKFTVKIPEMSTSSYAFRIVSSDNVSSEIFLRGIVTAPSAQLFVDGTPADNSTIFLDYGSQALLQANITGSEPFMLEYSDGTQQEVWSKWASYSPVVTADQSFSIKKISNSCGFGNVGGSVNVKIRPSLMIAGYPANTVLSVCRGQQIQIEYALGGIESLGSEYLVFSVKSGNQVLVKLDSTSNLSGRMMLTIPQDLAGGSVTIQASLASYQLTKNLYYLVYGKPDMTLFGDITIVAGETGKLFVKSNSSFAPNTAFELSDGSQHTFQNPVAGVIVEIGVRPTVTTTYYLKSTVTACGTPIMTGSVTVTVEQRKSNWLTVRSVSTLNKFNACNSDTLLIDFFKNVEGGTGESYQVMLSDSLGKNFTPILTIGNSSPLKAVIPAGQKASAQYRVRLTSSNPDVTGMTFQNLVNIREYAVAKVMTPELFYKSGESVRAVIALNGTPPFSYRYGDENLSRWRGTVRNSDTLTFIPLTPVGSYKILETGNACGPGKVEEPSGFRIELITATEPLLTEKVKFGPNPTHGDLAIWFEGAGSRELLLYNTEGKLIRSDRVKTDHFSMDIRHLSSGNYLLQIRKKDQSLTYRIMKK